ncbi:hypothetical protein [Croceicoccus sediminis]|uniref:hypothetical protein n=1 Tax=Croceicoccus sediminis TaxID=2571150 RepID=UPI0014796DAA|nr:hypothetical protein [Croceicoccus sediminis]
MKILAVATSPLQIQNVQQYIRQHDLDFRSCTLAHVGSVREEDNRRAIAQAAKTPFERIAAFAPYRPMPRKHFPNDRNWALAEHRNRQDYMAGINRLFSNTGADFDVVLLGDYRPMSFRQFLQPLAEKLPEIVLVDDGAVSRYVMSYRATGADAEEVTRGILPDLGVGDPFLPMEPAALTYFTIYGDESEIAQNDRVVRNGQFDRVVAGSFKSVEDVWICGTNHVEAKLARMDAYFSLCERIRDWFPDRRIVYFPHRREDSAKLERLQNRFGFVVNRNADGMERHVLRRQVVPHKIMVFGSTVADTLSRIYAERSPVTIVVPKDRYFTGSTRFNHVTSVLVDNVRRNSNVTAVSQSLSAIAPWASSTEVQIGGRFPAPVVKCDALYTDLQGLVLGGSEGGWTRFTETGGKNVHRATLLKARRDPFGAGFCHVFRLRAEERFAFKLRLAVSGGGFAEVVFEADTAEFHGQTNEIGSLFAEVHVDENRDSTITVFFKPATWRQVELQLFTLSKRGTESAKHQGMVTAGFSLAPFQPKEGRAIPLSVDTKSTEFQMGIARNATVLIRVSGRDADTFVCMHTGCLKPLRTSRLKAPWLGIDRIEVLNCSINFNGDSPQPLSARAPSDKIGKGLLRILSTTSPLRLGTDWRQRSVLAATYDKVPLVGKGAFDIGNADFRTGRDCVLASYVFSGKPEEKARQPFYMLF